MSHLREFRMSWMIVWWFGKPRLGRSLLPVRRDISRSQGWRWDST